MKHLLAIISLGIFLAATLVSCNEEPTLQSYFVDKQEDNRFVKFDVPSSLITEDSDLLNAEQKEVMQSVRKLNIMAYPIKDGDSLKTEYQQEKQNVIDILAREQYQTLISFGSPTQGASLKFVGETDAIDELVIFASDEERGFAIFRLTGNDMDPEKFVNMMRSIETGDLDVSQMNGLGQLFDTSDEDYDDSWEDQEGWVDDEVSETKLDSIIEEIED
ncbi:DUF4252 domain-containing protein [Gilvibacter sp. SZ-19]|uniref:DUF4252 domain-containing protein n=1 Tax=unclassified Gilvibacter TaxID=2625242 RepID=UPI000B3D4599|nr:DUF4252 domain-containing protein [Gilvibacter sp. SZ-19]ARV10931.1 hypothetical protein BTO09_00615 [Gilvibacter sp. SZ-19]